MTHSTLQKHRLPFGMLLIPLLISLACSTLTGGAGPSSDSPPGELTIEQDLVYGPGTFIYVDPRAGLTELSSYSASLTLTFEGTRDGSPFNWFRSYAMLATNEPHVRQWTIEDTSNGVVASPMFLAELDGVEYSRRGEEACGVAEIPADDPLSARMELVAFLSPVIGAEEGGTEKVNEIAASRYTFDQRALGEDGFIEATGEMWVADEGGFLVRYLLTTKGTEEYFGEGIEGTLSTTYDLTAPNQPVTIELPEDCPPGMVDAAVPPDATNILSLPGLLSYDTTTSAADTAAFHQEQIPTLGWVPEGEPAIGEGGAFLTFKRDEQVLIVIIGTRDDITHVNITVNPVGL